MASSSSMTVTAVNSFTYVIVGGGIAGVSCAEILQTIISPGESILIITASPGKLTKKSV